MSIPANPYIFTHGLPGNKTIENVTPFLHGPLDGSEARSAAKCWLSYRCCDGLIPFEEWERDILSVETRVDDEHLAVRWEMSLGTVTAYVYLLNDRKLDGLLKLKEVRHLWHNSAHIWSPQVTNYLRCSCLLAYQAKLDGEIGFSELVIADSMIEWQKSLGSFNWREWGLRPTEMRDDIVAAQLLLFIAGAPQMEWADWDSIQPKHRWNPFYDVLAKLKRDAAPKLPKYATREDLAASFTGIGVELGVARGDFSKTILERSKCEKLYSIDRWTDHHDAKEMLQAVQALSQYGVRSNVLRMSFADALPLIGNDSLDFCYIDGYAAGGQEDGNTLRDWWVKLKKGGIFAGHDYAPRWQPTIDAVDKFAAEVGFRFALTTGDEFASFYGRKT